MLGESQKEITYKYNYYKALGYKIIYCVGEPLEVKETGMTETLGYIWNQFEGIDLDYDNLIIAYEPVWAIGTGKIPTEEDITIIHKKIKKKITQPLSLWRKCKNIKYIRNLRYPKCRRYFNW